MPALGEVGGDPLLERLQTQLVEPSDLARERRFEREVGEGGTGPQRERFAQQVLRTARAPVREPGLAQEPLEALRVQLVGSDVQT